MGYFDFH